MINPNPHTTAIFYVNDVEEAVIQLNGEQAFNRRGEEPTQTTTTPKTNTQQSAPSGPPPGVTSGGAGGGSY